MKKTSQISVFMAMYAAIICITGFISIPLGPIPLVLQNVVAISAGLVFGLPQGAAAVGMFLAVGTLGLPVFSGARSGIAVLNGPTGGFLIGYFVGAFIAGSIATKPKVEEKAFSKETLFRLARGAIAGLAFTYLIGVLNFRRVTGTSFSQALSLCIIPFIIPDIIKICIMVPIVARLRPVVARHIQNDQGEEELS
ncbi:MAG: biotin transporter BioY [Treponema sp.]|nr:biotin transporter BioY [Spirochaetaceae bacterium]MEE0133620.1 biotin transporter BioY [Treponema sp.]